LEGRNGKRVEVRHEGLSMNENGRPKAAVFATSFREVGSLVLAEFVRDVLDSIGR
jgi:hypothetical protein